MMRYLALACDYDGTLACDGWVDRDTTDALRKVRDAGRRLVLVTGRELPDLLAIFPEPELFDRIVAENGAVLYRPATREERVLADPPPEQFVSALIEHRVEPLSIGRTIIATREPNETIVLDIIRQLGLERQVVFNKGAVMVLPSGVNKASGLDAALADLGLSPHNCVAIGDAENDHAFLSGAECGVAVANALPALKDIADLVTAGDHGTGARELIDRLIADDLADLESRLSRHAVALGARADGTVDWPPYGRNLLIAGPSASGKSTIAGGILDRLSERGYQYCILDPEGDYTSASGVVVLGDSNSAPTVAEMLDVLKTPAQSLVMNLVGVPLEHRPEFFAGAFARLQELRAKTGRPHQIVIDEAHHLMPAESAGAPTELPAALDGTVLITVHPGHVMAPALRAIDAIVAVGTTPAATMGEFAEAIGRPMPALPASSLEPGELLLWKLAGGDPVEHLRAIPSRSERRRHLRKYAEGDLGESRSFYFRGPEGKLNLRAQHLVLFLQVADGVDDDTWRHHLERHDYSQWFREAIKDEELASEVAAIEARPGLDARESRDLVRTAISQRYTV